MMGLWALAGALLLMCLGALLRYKPLALGALWAGLFGLRKRGPFGSGLNFAVSPLCSSHILCSSLRSRIVCASLRYAVCYILRSFVAAHYYHCLAALIMIIDCSVAALLITPHSVLRFAIAHCSLYRCALSLCRCAPVL
jgi:hypothetical protein